MSLRDAAIGVHEHPGGSLQRRAAPRSASVARRTGRRARPDASACFSSEFAERAGKMRRSNENRDGPDMDAREIALICAPSLGWQRPSEDGASAEGEPMNMPKT